MFKIILIILISLVSIFLFLSKKSSGIIRKVLGLEKIWNISIGRGNKKTLDYIMIFGVKFVQFGFIMMIFSVSLISILNEDLGALVILPIAIFVFTIMINILFKIYEVILY